MSMLFFVFRFLRASPWYFIEKTLGYIMEQFRTLAGGSSNSPLIIDF